ncbi:TonB-dependent receptor [Terriglobus albidus]|uniref:TonB-dependent receptor n=1 Tax=Terriglobus albidus TaxID=1592106 RepID=A0A5B9E469_9BACT|nr:TonB-dependent receptor [Terriglobus albidus]QEE27032.1 TonB-dependent receptor [Terriglobus albidus]
MSKLRGFLSLASAAILGVSLNAVAQSTTQGAIAGTVFDTTDAVVSNAKITIHNDGTNQDVVLTSESSGEYRAPLLPPGTYTVTVDMAGFAASKTTQVVVQVGQVTTLNPHLSAGKTEQTVEVVADIPAIDFASATYGGHLSNTEIENIPINNRRWSSLALVTPGVTNDASGFGLLSFRAISAVLNNVQIDGTDDNQAFFGEERGRTRAGYSTSQVAVREFQVNTGVYSAEYGRAVGGVVNSVTKSGTNSLHGEVYFYHRNDKLSSINPKVNFPSFNTSTGKTDLIPFRPKDKRNQFGFGVGGALIKDKLFWFYAFDEFRRNFPGVAVAADPTSFFNTALPAGLAARGVTQARFTSALNELATELGQVPRYGNQNINTPKLDWQITPKHHVSFLYHRLRWDSPGGVQTQAAVSYARDSFGTDFVKLDYGVAKLDSLISSKMTNELRYMYGRELNWEGQQPYTDYSKSHFTGTNGNVPAVGVFTSVGFNAGSQYYSYRTSYPDERKWQIGDTASYSFGKHTLRFGTDILQNYDVFNNLYQSNGSYSYGSIANFLADIIVPNGACASSTGSTPAFAAANATTVYPCYSSINQGLGRPNFDLKTIDYGFFAQDDWKLSPNLTLNLGVRYDYESIPAPYSFAITAPQTAQHPSDKNNIAPRIGFAYDPFGRGKTVVRGGFGLYYGRVPNGVLLNTYANTGSTNAQAAFTYYNTSGVKLPNILGSGNPPSNPSIFYLANNLQNPYAEQFDLTVQQDLGKNNVLTLAYMGSLGRELPNYLNYNLDPTQTFTQSYTVTGSGNCGPLACGTVLTSKVYANRFVSSSGTKFNTLNPTYNAITGVLSNVNSSYNALTVDITRRSGKWLSYDANYTWAHALDYSQNQFTTAGANNWYDPYANPRSNYGNSSLNIRHRLVGWAIFNIPGRKDDTGLGYLTNGWSIKPLIQAQTGLPYSAGVSGTGPNQSSGCAATTATTGCLVPYSSGLGGTGVTYIPQLGRNSFYMPRAIVIDARLQKDFKLHEKYTFQLMAEGFNLANHQNVTGVGSTAYNMGSGTTTLTYQATSFGIPSSSGVNSNYAYQVRQFQFSGRIVF